MTALQTSKRDTHDGDDDLLNEMGVQFLQPSTSKEVDFANTLNEFALFCLNDDGGSLMHQLLEN